MTTFAIELPANVKKIIETIEENGYEAFAVGGCVRDTLLDKVPDDWDITTSALPSEVKSLFKRTIDTGIVHGTVTVMLEHTGYEVTTYRIDGEYEDSRHPKSVEFASQLTDDLMRRDFTINAMAYNNRVGLVDKFGGIKDLNEHIIRCVGNPIERFTEDALRMMRAIRFSAQLGFIIDSGTYNAIVELAPSISRISMERVHVELGKTLLSNHPDYVVMYAQTGLFKEILPVIQHALDGKYSKKILAMLRIIKTDLILRYAALFSTSTPDEAYNSLRALKMDCKTMDTVRKILSFAKYDIEETEPAVRAALHKYGRDMLPYIFDYTEASIKASEEITGISNPTKNKHLINLRRLCKDILERGDCFSLKDLDITGNDLIEYGLTGPDIGKTLNALLAMVIENPKLNDKATLISMIGNIN
ncbi:MAG: CCA tRNA nucleotidyltransferase [Lachnospira sp.]